MNEADEILINVTEELCRRHVIRCLDQLTTERRADVQAKLAAGWRWLLLTEWSGYSLSTTLLLKNPHGDERDVLAELQGTLKDMH